MTTHSRTFQRQRISKRGWLFRFRCSHLLIFFNLAIRFLNDDRTLVCVCDSKTLSKSSRQTSFCTCRGKNWRTFFFSSRSSQSKLSIFRRNICESAVSKGRSVASRWNTSFLSRNDKSIGRSVFRFFPQWSSKHGGNTLKRRVSVCVDVKSFLRILSQWLRGFGGIGRQVIIGISNMT